MTDPSDTELNDLFDSIKVQKPLPSDDLMARVLADADALQPEPQVISNPRSSQPRASLWDMIGGWPALTGVAAAGVAGLWLGIAPPTSIDQWTASILGNTTSVSFLLDDTDWFGEITDG